MHAHDEQLIDQLYQQFVVTQTTNDCEISFKGKIRFYAQLYARNFAKINSWESVDQTNQARYNNPNN